MAFELSLLDFDVRPNDLDSLGHVNNAVALEYLEAGRWAWMDQHSLLRGSVVVPVVTRIEVDYRREIRPQRVTVQTTLQQADAEADTSDTYKVRFQQEILIHRGAKAAVIAGVEVAFIDARTRSLASLRDFLAASQPAAS